MGSYEHLRLGALEIAWGKNECFENHSRLFRVTDLTKAPYQYADTVAIKEAYVRPLRDTVRRLEMLGYTPTTCQEMFSCLEQPPADKAGNELSWDEYVEALHRITPGPSTALRHRLEDYVDEEHSIYVLDPYVALRMLAEKPENLDLPLVWEFADLVEGGWLDPDLVYTGIDREHVRLVVTEGSSDGAILQAALPLVAGDIDDFFDFIDMADNYPFTGTGNLLRFCQGLARIAVQNRLLIVLDNDTAGQEVFNRLKQLSLPESMVITTLPDLDICRNIATLGPDGPQRNDINGRAVSIECFLDIWKGSTTPTVRWTTYNAHLDAYQGALIDKERYSKTFFDALRTGTDYDLTSLQLLWNHLVHVSVVNSGA